MSITRDDEVAYGPELISMTMRAARQAVQGDLGELHHRQEVLAQREQKLQNQMVFQALDAAMPDWRTINNSEVFKAWLSQQETLSGVVAWDLLLDAFHRADVPRILRFFQDFRAIGQAPQAPAPRGHTSPRQPATTTTVAAATAALVKLLDDSRKGYYSGPEREAKKLAEERRLHDIIHGRR